MSMIIFAFFSEFEKDVIFMTLRERIKDLCKNKKISVNRLEIDCGFAKGYISKLDRSKPNSENLHKISDYLGVSLDYLMTGNEKNEMRIKAETDMSILSDERLIKALNLYLAHDEKTKDKIVRMIELMCE